MTLYAVFAVCAGLYVLWVINAVLVFFLIQTKEDEIFVCTAPALVPHFVPAVAGACSPQPGILF